MGTASLILLQTLSQGLPFTTASTSALRGHEMRKNHLGDCIMFSPGALSQAQAGLLITPASLPSPCHLRGPCVGEADPDYLFLLKGFCPS